MDKNEKKSVKNPRKGANPLSVFTFKWMFGTFLTGYKRELEVSDLYSPLDEHSSRILGDKTFYLWNQELEKYQKYKKAPSLVRVLMKCFGRDFIMFGLCTAFNEFFIKTTRPIILVNLLRYFRGNREMESTEAYYWATGLVLGIFLDILIFHNTFQGQMHIGLKLRVACCSLIYRKVLKVPSVASEGKSSIGQMINFLSNDVNIFDYATSFFHSVWIAPVQTILISYLLYKEVGLAAFGGIIIILLFIPIHGFHGKLADHLTSKLAYLTDERLRLTNQIISGVKIIKMYAWEKPFIYLNDMARKNEVKIIRSSMMANDIHMSYRHYIPQVCICVTILVYILLGNNIDAEKVYFLTAYYNILRNSFYDLLPLSVKFITEGAVSLKRIKKFLLSEEIKEKNLSNNKLNSKTVDKVSLLFKNVTAKWNLESKYEALEQISFQMQSGSLTAVIGHVGAGKTALIQAILNEIAIVQGEIKINGKISYACQEPWLFTSSVKQNVLFGKPMDKERYDKVIQACQLKRDFHLLPYGENTLVGERGINLSGGQCARINLARAVYHEADIYLLDDPLSAVDTQVGKGIFEDCIKTFLKGKTVILVTHQLHYLKHVDRIIVVDHGTVLADGTYASLVDSGQLKGESNEVTNNERCPAKENKAIVEPMNASIVAEEKSEGRSKGSLKWETYLKFFKAANNGCLVFLVFLISMICQISRSGADYFIAHWVNVEEKRENFTYSSGDSLPRDRDWYIYVYCSVILVSVLVTLAQTYTHCHMGMKISRNLHAMMFTSIIKTKITFFKENPIGRITNRFSKDMRIIDTTIPWVISEVMQIALLTFGIVGIVANVYPWFLIVALVIAVVIYLFRSFYVKTIRAIKRLDGITRSPIFNHLSASVRGLTTIRALNAQQILMNDFDNYQDLNSSALFMLISGSRACSMYIDFLCALFTGIVTYTLLSLTGIITAGDAGLAFTQCTLLILIVQLGVRFYTDLENHMISVERILEYSALEQEPLLERKPGNKAPEKWPQHGQILFKDVSLIYDHQEKPALRNLNFTIKPNEMIGIVGRTGAGKSSVINALFRLADIEGEIYIDNVATSRVALQDLRSKISIIPQEPVLFAGSVRRNLDPLDEYTDDLLWQALEEVQLKASLQPDAGLNTPVAEGGTNFSVGQRQLLCLARAIVKNNKVLVLDEATANVDPLTDELIQKAIRKKFVDCTVLIIAHRLNTVMDSSKILVMDAGRVVEFDHPYKLLQQRSGVLYNMVQQTGVTTAENLFQIAKLNYENNRTHEIVNK